jgi:hypothetical protein
MVQFLVCVLLVFVAIQSIRAFLMEVRSPHHSRPAGKHNGYRLDIKF